MKGLFRRIKVIAKDTGCIDIFFDKPEGSLGEDIFAVYDPDEHFFRAYCIRLGQVAIILGGGGNKTTRTWQQDTALSEAMYELKKILRAFDEKIQLKEIRIDYNGSLIGDLILNIES